MKPSRPPPPDPQQLARQLDFFSDHPASAPGDDAVRDAHDVGSPAGNSSPSQKPRADTKPVSPATPPTPKPSVPLPVSADGTPADGKRRIELGQHRLDYRLCRSKRRSIGFLVDEDGLRITAPKWVTLAEIDQAIREKQRWIMNKLTERRERSAQRLQPEMQWRDGGTLPYLGNDLVLRLRTDRAAGVAFDAATHELTVSLPPQAGEQQLKDRVQGWLQQEAKRIFSERLPVYAERLGLQYRAFALSSATTQWGSCTADGRIRLNWRLIHFAMPLIDYVIAHELAHLREMNHSPRFWATVESIYPDFVAARQTLRKRGPETLPIF